MFGSTKNASGQPPERTKAPDPTTDQFDDVPPMPEALKPAGVNAAPKKAFNFSDKPKPQPADDAAHLYIGANIRLKGEIAGCDMMRVEGIYEGIAKARQLVLCPGGSFLGTAEIEDAEIEGTFEGALHVRGRLYLRKQGRIRGTFSYGQLEIERGGEIDGRILPFDKKPTQAAPPVKTVEPSRPVEAARPVDAPRPAAQPVAAAVPAAAQPLAQAAVMARPSPPRPAPALNGSGPAAAE